MFANEKLKIHFILIFLNSNFFENGYIYIYIYVTSVLYVYVIKVRILSHSDLLFNITYYLYVTSYVIEEFISHISNIVVVIM